MAPLDPAAELLDHTVEVNTVDGAVVGESTSQHPADIPRQPVRLGASLWTGALHTNLNEALSTLLDSGFAVFDSPEAMFRARSGDIEDQHINAEWFMTAPTALDTTTIPYTQWLPLQTHHRFARYLRAKIDHRVFHTVGEEFGGVLSIGGFRRRNLAKLGPQANLHFLHQDECKLSVSVAEAAAQPHGAAGPFDGVDTVQAEVCESFGRGLIEGAGPAMRPVCCRQVNFWLPHERNGDKYLLVLSRKAAEAMVQQGTGFITACTLPRHSDSDVTPTLVEVNRNFQPTARAIEFVAENMPGHLHLINKPVIFISKYSQVGEGRQPLSRRSDAAKAIFHCGIVLEGLGHCSTELRVAILSTPTA